MITLLQKEYNVMDKDTYPWEVYTQKDIQMNSSKIGTPHHHPTTYNRKVGSQNTSKSNKNSVFSLLNRCKPSLEESYSPPPHNLQQESWQPKHIKIQQKQCFLPSQQMQAFTGGILLNPVYPQDASSPNQPNTQTSYS